MKKFSLTIFFSAVVVFLLNHYFITQSVVGDSSPDLTYQDEHLVEMQAEVKKLKQHLADEKSPEKVKQYRVVLAIAEKIVAEGQKHHADKIFYQAQQKRALKLYKEALRHIDPGSEEVVLDRATMSLQKINLETSTIYLPVIKLVSHCVNKSKKLLGSQNPMAVLELEQVASLLDSFEELVATDWHFPNLEAFINMHNNASAANRLPTLEAFGDTKEQRLIAANQAKGLLAQFVKIYKQR